MGPIHCPKFLLPGLGLALKTYGRRFGECIPQPLARKAWGWCPAVSMREIYYALAAWHPAGCSVWVVSHSRILSRGNIPTGQWGPSLLVGGLYSPSHLSVVGYLQNLIRVVAPPTSLLHPCREAAVGPRLLIRREIPSYLAAIASISRGHSTIRYPWTFLVAFTALQNPELIS